MIAFLNKLNRSPCETIDQYCRRRKREARNLAAKEDFWSPNWAKRLCNWISHLSRAQARNHHCVRRFLDRGPAWLQARRKLFVAVNGSGYSRNRIECGRTGTQLNIGRPQPRWCESALLARRILEVSCNSRRNNNARTIATMYSEVSKDCGELTNSNLFELFGECRLPSVTCGTPREPTL